MGEREDAIQATADDLMADADQLKAIEAEKAALDADDPRADELAVAAEVLTKQMAAKATAQREIAAEE